MRLTKQQERTMESAMEYVRNLFAENAGGHDAEHTFRVFRNAKAIAAGEPVCDLFVVLLAALLHDADDYKLFHTEDNANARNFLEKEGVPQETIERICDAVNSVSFSKNRGREPATLEGKIVQDADRLDAIGAVGIARTFAFGGAAGRPMADSVQHFHEKLLLLKDEMNTETALQEAKMRHVWLEEFLHELNREESWEKERSIADLRREPGTCEYQSVEGD